MNLLYRKTPKAWDSLAQPAHLGRLAHTIVLMANGRRSLKELAMLTGSEIESVVRALCMAGYLEPEGLDPAPPIHEAEWH